MTDDWPFDPERNALVIATRQVVHKAAPVRKVIHYAEYDSWAFLEGDRSGGNDWLLIGIGIVADMDRTLAELADLPPGWIAERRSAGDA